MEEKSLGHRKLERVNRRLEEDIGKLRHEYQRSAEFIKLTSGFPSLSADDQDKILRYLKGQGEDSKISDLHKHIEKLSGFLDNRKAEVAALKQQRRDSDRLEQSARKRIRDVLDRLWGGYSQESIVAMTELSNCPFISNDVRAEACFELARFFTDSGQVHAAARLMSMARSLSKTFMRGMRPRILDHELLLLTDDLSTAQERLQTYLHYRPEDPDLAIGLANYHYTRKDQKAQLDAVNALFALNGMAPIKVLDPDNPFLSLTSEREPTPVENGPKVSVLMSSYNSAEFLELAVRSMQEQTWRNLEIIITDDCSTDNSLEILDAMAAKDPRIVVIANQENYGTYGNRNRMLDVSTGEFVTVHDSDDWSHPQMIEDQMRHLQENPDIRVNTTLMCRVSLDLRFHIRPSRRSLEYCHMNYPGFLMRTEDVRALGGWDPIMANADAEFERRIKQVFGRNAFAVIDTKTVYSFFLVHENSLTQQKLMNLRSLTFGSRSEYHRQSEFWMEGQRKLAESSGDPIGPFALSGRSARSLPFPSPNALLPPSLKQDVLKYDVLLVSDLFLLGGTRSCNANYARMMHAMGKKVAVFNWPRADLAFPADINPIYRQLAQDGIIEIVTWEDSIQAKTTIVHHPPLANTMLDKLPTVETEKVAVLINQLPFQTEDRETYFYQPADVTARLMRVFNTENVEWVAISPLTKTYIGEYASDIRISDQIWYPPIFLDKNLVTTNNQDRFERLQKPEGPLFSRHSRDHWTKWPNASSRIEKMYMANANHRFSILGGGKALGRNLLNIPSNWEILAYDSISVDDLLRTSDIFLNFKNEVYIEEFGRNVMEAMVHGLPVITEQSFTSTFGDAILDADATSTEDWLEKLRSNRAFFDEQVERGHRFVQTHCATESVSEKLQAYLES